MDMIDRTALPDGGAAPDIVVSMPPLDELANLWPIVEPMLRRATDRVRGYEPIDLLQLTMLGRMSMLVIREQGAVIAVAVTEVKQYPRCRVLEVPFIGGTGLKRWAWQLVDVLDAQAEALGCVDIVGGDRKGWARFGFVESGVSLVRRLKE
jgi:hypothetical protein